VGHDGLGAVLVDNAGPARLDLGQRFVPADALKMPDPWDRRASWVQQPVGIVVMPAKFFSFNA